MSGILGIWNLGGRPVERSELSRLSRTLSHRGHDGEGVEIRGSVGLACCLSRVTPEAADETQPLLDSSGVMLVFDGRLDNRKELLASLDPAPQVSASSSDAALVLAAYVAFGDTFAAHLNGDFAVGLFDPRQRTVVLARDAVGVRPLYYYATSELFLFASEMKAILAHSRVVSRADDDVVADFLFKQLAGEDPSGRTFFQNIFSVLPAHIVTASPGKVRARRYWDFDLGRHIRFGSFEEAAEAFRDRFEEAVRRRLRSTAPVAVSVSGGLDSSAIFCVGETIRRKDPEHVPALQGVSYTAPDGAPADEKAFLIDIERAYAVEIRRLDDLPGGIMDACTEAIWHVEAPVLEGNWSGTHAYYSAIRQRGARVLLTGHWGDQFLFDDAYLVDLCGRGAWREVCRHVNEYGHWVDISANSFRRRLFGALLRHHAPAPIVSALRGVRDRFRPAPELRPWYTDAFRRRAPFRGIAESRDLNGVTAHARSLYREARSRYHVFCMEWNNKVAAMHGLEMAFPFLDRDLIGFLMAIPGELQSWNGVHKGILRRALRGVLPDTIARRVAKADFTGVVNKGVAKDYDRLVQCLQTGGMATALGYVRPESLREMAGGKLETQASTCELSWALIDLFSLELWLQQFFRHDSAKIGMEAPDNEQAIRT